MNDCHQRLLAVFFLVEQEMKKQEEDKSRKRKIKDISCCEECCPQDICLLSSSISFCLLLSTTSANLHSLLLVHEAQSPSFCTMGSSLSPIEKTAATAPSATSEMTTISRKDIIYAVANSSLFTLYSSPQIQRPSGVPRTVGTTW